MLLTFAHLALGSTSLAACASAPRPGPPRLLRVEGRAGSLSLEIPAAAPAEDAAWMLEASEHALAQLARYQLRLHTRCLVRLHLSVQAFTDAIDRTDAWLRAWASYDRVDVLTPAYWRDGSPEARRQRLAHELTHCACWQRLGSEADARATRLPWWFEEGSASVVAAQGERRMPLALIVDRLPAGTSPLEDRAALQGEQLLAYGVAHHAVATLVQERGTGVIAALLDATRGRGAHAGAFGGALSEVCALDPRSLWARVVAGEVAKEEPSEGRAL